MWTRILERIGSPAGPALLIALAVLLSAQSLFFGLQTDDHMHGRSFADGVGAWELLQLPAPTVEAKRQVGEFSWWSSPQLAVRFFRPLASAIHFVEFTLWPSAAWAMHLTNVLVYALLVVVAAIAYRELAGPGMIATLAALMFAVDDGHGSSVGWISGRNTLLAALFALLALLLYARGRARERFGLVLASAGCTALALLSAEFGLFAFAYLGAYALVLDRGPLRTRLLALAPHALVAVGWAAIYASGGYGLRHAGWYRDPAEAPVSVLLQGLADVPVWAFSQLGLNIAEFAVMADATALRLTGLVLLVPVLAWLWPALRRERIARFFALGLLLSLPPLFTTHPQGRLLIGASFGGLGWIACAIAPPAPEVSSRFMRFGQGVLRTLHVVLAPLLFVVMVGQLIGIERAAQAFAAQLPRESGREVVIVNLPFELLTQVAWMIHAESGAPPLDSLHQLYAGNSALTVERIDDRTLDVTANGGWGRVPFERLFSAREDMPRLGETRDFRNLSATVLEVNASGLPARVRFEFPTALESERRTWLVWLGRRPARWQPPQRGERLSLAPVSPLDLDGVRE